MVYHNLVLISPYIIEQVKHDQGCFIPDEPIIALDKKYQRQYLGYLRQVAHI
jgi:ABC-type hemin transport system ATPase subunit